MLKIEEKREITPKWVTGFTSKLLFVLYFKNY
jgi:hypothetical protein